MGTRRRKNRTHLKGPQKGETEENVPKSFVIKSGDVTKSISQLVKDMRRLMEPNTATRLRERPNARLRDYLTIAPSLHVTHLLAFTLTDAANVHLRMARLPQGPTLTFRVQRYSLMKDLVNSALRSVGKAPGSEYRNPPLLVLNNFNQQPDQPVLPQLRLMSTMFQGLFPAISVEKSALPTFRRVLLISYNPTTNLISLRHYTITVRAHGVSRRVRKLLTTTATVKSKNLHNQDDFADYLLGSRRGGTPSTDGGGAPSTVGYESNSESEMSEAESDTNAVELPEDYGRGNKKGERKAVRLIETGPRLELRLIKVVEGLVGSKRGEGETVFHEIVHKTKAQTTEQKREHEERRKLREARRAEQAANVARKKAERAKASGKPLDDADADQDDLDVEGLSDADPEEELERIRKLQLGVQDDEEDDDEDEFAYEDAAALDDDDEEEEDDGGDWDEDAGVGEVSSDEEEEEREESSADEAPPPPKRLKDKRGGGKAKR